jgi:sulfur-carrier protein adenylyltransferase/sulfurtransferase
MFLKHLFSSVKTMSSEEVKRFIAEHSPDAYTLLDVRTLREYEQAHIPGAKFIPISELSDRLHEIERNKPVLTYCAVGGRSHSAAQLLEGQGFTDVYNIKGGIRAWAGLEATGPPDYGLYLIKGDESPERILTIAYGMEDGLSAFYKILATKISDPPLNQLFTTLADFEEKHKDKLFDLYLRVTGATVDLHDFINHTTSDVMEGGGSLEEFLKVAAEETKTLAKIFDLALSLETQALDLYLRFAQKLTMAPTKDIIVQMAQEEKFHLAKLEELSNQNL